MQENLFVQKKNFAQKDSTYYTKTLQYIQYIPVCGQINNAYHHSVQILVFWQGVCDKLSCHSLTYLMNCGIQSLCSHICGNGFVMELQKIKITLNQVKTIHTSMSFRYSFGSRKYLFCAPSLSVSTCKAIMMKSL